jgi:16S rRNA (guanine527-N7)-methyltransferase
VTLSGSCCVTLLYILIAIEQMEIILRYFTDFTDQQLSQFKALEPLYKDWNSKINIISRKDIDSLYEKHVLHSLSIAAAFDFAEGAQVVDIGTGGGFPGIPLAIFFPSVHFHLVDSIAKKLKVVEAIAKEIHLKNVTTQHTRAEEIKNRKFDFAVSRAVAPLKDLWKWSKPLLRLKGQDTKDKEQKTNKQKPETSPQVLRRRNQQHGLICLKGGDLAQEISESGIRPSVMEISEIFPEEFFKEKYILYVPR